MVSSVIDMNIPFSWMQIPSILVSAWDPGINCPQIPKDYCPSSHTFLQVMQTLPSCNRATSRTVRILPWLFVLIVLDNEATEILSPPTKASERGSVWMNSSQNWQCAIFHWLPSSPTIWQMALLDKSSKQQASKTSSLIVSPTDTVDRRPVLWERATTRRHVLSLGCQLMSHSVECKAQA